MRILTIALAATFAMTAISPALAKGPKHCPPGLAKKNPPCIPPGLAKGDRFPDGYERWDEYSRYRLPDLKEGEAWYNDGNIVYKVDSETRRVIEMIRLIDLVANG